MKARSVVFTHVQYPPTYGGLPPMLIGLVAMAGLLAYFACVIVRATAIMIPGAVVAAGIAYVAAYFVAKKDHHFQSVFQTSARFWKGSSCRRLLAGAPPSRSGRGRS